jgi:myosin V
VYFHSLTCLSQIKIAASNGNEDVASIVNFDEVKTIAELLQLNEVELNKSLLEKTITSVGEVIDSPLSVASAKENRDSFAKYLYASLFGWLVHRINLVCCSLSIS